MQLTTAIWWATNHKKWGFGNNYGVQGIQELLRDLIPHLGFDAVRDVQVLCPMTRGDVGTRNLNTVLQELLNPPRLDMN